MELESQEMIHLFPNSGLDEKNEFEKEINYSVIQLSGGNKLTHQMKRKGGDNDSILNTSHNNLPEEDNI